MATATRAEERPSGVEVSDRFCWVILGVAMAISAALILYLNRGTFFYLDELSRVFRSPDFDLRYVLDPHGGHLTATSNLLVQGMLEVFGPDYVPFRVLGVLPVLLCPALFFALAKSRIGALPALAPAFVLLFFGSAWEMVVIPFGFAVVTSTALGLAALLALERGDRRGDLAASLFACLSVVTFSVGLAFVVGIAISVLLREDRWRRAWIPLVPIILYGAWWLWALSEPSSSGEELRATNMLGIPAYIAEALAAASASIAGLSYDFADPLGVELGWGRILAVLAVLALALRIKRGNVPRSLWASLGIALTLWTLGALVVGILRDPSAPRYIFAGGVAVLLVATDAARSVRFSRMGLAALFAACAVSLATNIALLREGAVYLRDYAAEVRADLAVADLARDHVDPGFEPLGTAPLAELLNTPASTYFAVVDRYGSPAFSLSELERQDDTVRQGADQVLAEALGLRLTTSGVRPGGECTKSRGDQPGGPIVVDLPTGGATLRGAGDDGSVEVGRFGTAPSAEVGRLRPGETAELRIPTDSAPQRWRAAIARASSVKVCGLG